MKVATVVGTRPEIIRLSRIIHKLDQHFKHCLIHTGQNYDYELNEIFFEDLEIRKPDYFLNAAGETPMATIGQVLAKGDEVLAKVQPEALLLLGDTNSALIAIAAKRQKIPIFHMEAGNRCFDYRVPEEINRKIVDHISDINLPYSTIARDYLIAENFPAQQVIKTGSPMREVIQYYYPKSEQSNVLQRLGVQKHEYFVVSSHREENVDSPEKLKRLIAILTAIYKQYQLPIIFSTHPRTRKRLKALSLGENQKGVQFLKPLGFTDYLRLQCAAKVTLSDSGTITEESSILNFPAINLRETHERPEGMEEGAVMMTGLDLDRILGAIQILETQSRGDDRNLKLVTDYETDNVSDKMIRIILSYTNYVNQFVWKKK